MFPGKSRASEVPGERERHALGGGNLPRLRHRHQRGCKRHRTQTGGGQRALAGAATVRERGHKQAEEGEGCEEKARLLEDHDDEALGVGGGRNVSEQPGDRSRRKQGFRE